MAHALFTEHPMEQYLRDEAGEFDALTPFLPGIHPLFDNTIYPLPKYDLRFLAPLFELVSVTVREEQRLLKAAEQFTDQFKYRLVSSPLLSSNLASAAAHQTSFHSLSPTNSSSLASFQVQGHATASSVPGRWNLIPPNTHIKLTPVVVVDEDDDENSFDLRRLDYQAWFLTLPSFPFLGIGILLVLRFPVILATFFLLGVPFLPLPGSDRPSVAAPEDVAYSETLGSLDALIGATHNWDHTTTKALSLLSNPTVADVNSPLTPPLAHSLHATLSQTNNRMSTIRSLLSALARSPRELQMMEKMYGAPSPSPFSTSFSDRARERSNSNGRMSVVGTGARKRMSTMGLSYERPYSLVETTSSSPMYDQDETPSAVSELGHSASIQRLDLGRERRFSTVGGLSRLGGRPSNVLSPERRLGHERFSSLHRSSSLLAFRTTSSSLTGNTPDDAESLLATPEPSHIRGRNGMSQTVPSSPLTRFASPFHSRKRSLSKPSSLTNVRSNFLSSSDRDPLSAASLRVFHEQTRANIRHTAACLLALRFHNASPPRASTTRTDSQESKETDFLSPHAHMLIRKPSDDTVSLSSMDDELDPLDHSRGDPAYWEDVRSVLALLKSALEDASDRLQDSVHSHSHKSAAPRSPTADSANLQFTSPPPPPISLNLGPLDTTSDVLSILKRKGVSEKGLGGGNGYAPMPSHLSRFARHIEAMQEAINDARSALKETFDRLAGEDDDEYVSATGSLSATSSSDSASVSATPNEKTLNTFERVRNALGIALRECERSRGPLSEHLRPDTLVTSQSIPEEESDQDQVGTETPQLVEDDGRSSTESADVQSPKFPQHVSVAINTDEPDALIVEGNPSPTTPMSRGPTLQALLSEALRAIPEGKEKVYEADSTAEVYTREKSTLSREERIQQVKALRDSVSSIGSTAGMSERRRLLKKPKSRTMGPTSDVVQELKDALWMVSERRRKMGLTGTRTPRTSFSSGSMSSASTVSTIRGRATSLKSVI